MNRMKKIYDCLQSYYQWFFMLLATNGLFSFLAWLAYPETFKELIGLMIVFTCAIMSLAMFMVIRKQERLESVFQDFLLEPNEVNEERLCQVSPTIYRTSIKDLGTVMRSYESRMNDEETVLKDYENYIEIWAHEIKKPLSLMTLVLDNRSDEMSPLVKQRMFHVRDQMLGDVGRMLFYARLGATHKDYIFEPLNILSFSKEMMMNHQSLLDEANFQVQFNGENAEVLSDRKGLAFILEQIIYNSTKYATQNEEQPLLKFETVIDHVKKQTILHMTDNGPGVAAEDLPFIFEKGFTGGHGTYTKHATGMGLFLVSKMANDLAIQLDVTSEEDFGLTISLGFPWVG